MIYHRKSLCSFTREISMLAPTAKMHSCDCQRIPARSEQAQPWRICDAVAPRRLHESLNGGAVRRVTIDDAHPPIDTRCRTTSQTRHFSITAQGGKQWEVTLLEKRENHIIFVDFTLLQTSRRVPILRFEVIFCTRSRVCPRLGLRKAVSLVRCYGKCL